jgi:hypothetical protein
MINWVAFDDLFEIGVILSLLTIAAAYIAFPSSDEGWNARRSALRRTHIFCMAERSR